MDKLLFGDNQFFGVNHMSEEKARAQSIRFQNIQAVIDTIDIAHEAGIRTFMCTTHDRIREVCDHVRAHPERYSDYLFYPGMPYAHKYANAVTEEGLFGSIQKFLPNEGFINAVVRGASSFARTDIEGIITLLVDAEMKMFHGLKTPVIFLQNVVVDFVMGLGANEAFKIFSDHVQKRYNAEPGFITMNTPRLLDVLDKQGILNPIVCSNINKIGFRMCGGIDAYVDALKNRQFRAIAMSVFASGAIDPEEAIKWVVEQPNIKSIVFGASSRGNIVKTRDIVNKYWQSKAG